MNFERINDMENPSFKKAAELYKISFPPHEQREPFSQEAIMNDPHYHFDVIYDDNEFIGEVLYWDIGDFLYIEHFCISPEKRNKRYGQKTLEIMQYRPLILEIDPPIDEISKRRKNFYERNGFFENPYSHIHPPYHEGNMGHELIIMSSPRTLTQAEYDRFRNYLNNTVMRNVYKVK